VAVGRKERRNRQDAKDAKVREGEGELDELKSGKCKMKNAKLKNRKRTGKTHCN